jgi:hypothetical protein
LTQKHGKKLAHFKNRYKMIKFFEKTYLYLIGAIIGGVLGYFYYLEVSCTNGACLITSNPLITIAYGSITGAVFLSLFEPMINKFKSKKKNKHGKDKSTHSY